MGRLFSHPLRGPARVAPDKLRYLLLGTVPLAALFFSKPLLAAEPLEPDLPPASEAPVYIGPRSQSRPMRSIREERRIGVLGELGWNGLAGVGPTFVFHAHPYVSFDLGAGLSALGPKAGLRGRINFLKSSVTPFVGLGIIGAAGYGDEPVPFRTESEDGEALEIRLKPTTFVQMVGGIDWTSRSGFTLLGAVGYAGLVSEDPVEVVVGVPKKEDKIAFDVVYRSGIVISIAIGYTLD